MDPSEFLLQRGTSVSGGNLGVGKSSGGASNAVQIPEFLRPFVQQSTGTASRALAMLEGLNGGGPTGPQLLNDVRGPTGGQVFIDPQQQAFVDASGSIIAPITEGRVPGLVNGSNNPVEVRGGAIVGVGNNGVNDLGIIPSATGASGGVGADALVAGFTPAQQAAQALALDRATRPDGLFRSAQNAALSQLQGGGGVTSAVDELRRLTGSVVPSSSTDALTATARGDFLFGGAGFDAAVDAAVRRATPGILSTFGAAGAGGATGGLAQEALGTAAIDAFASQFAQERSNQLGAAESLGTLAQADAARQVTAASNLGALTLGELGQQLEAAQLLPSLGVADINLLAGVGDQQQALEQFRLDAPRLSTLQLLQAALGGSPVSDLFGERSRFNQRQVGVDVPLS